MKSKSPIIPHRVRRITGSFSWLDHRLLHHGFVQQMQSNDMLLYFFLVLVGDKNGVSYYSYDRIYGLLKITVDELIAARDRLIDMSLIAFDNGRYQVLSLPIPAAEKPVKRHCQIVSIKQLLQEMVPR
jgi:hypothetical protein